MQFVDTNILVYSISGSPSEAAKCAAASAILSHTDCVLSVQVLQEFYVQVTRASRPHPLDHVTAVELIETWMRFPIVDMTLSILKRALDIRQRNRFSYWDSAVLAAAQAAGCDTVLTEDLSHGQRIEGMRIVNPFR